MENKTNNNLFLEKLHEYAMETFDDLIIKNGGREYEGDDSSAEEKIDFLLLVEEFYFFYVKRHHNFDLFKLVLFQTIDIMKDMGFSNEDIETIKKFDDVYFKKYNEI